MKPSVAALIKIVGLFLLLASCGASTLKSRVFHELMDFRNQRADHQQPRHGNQEASGGKEPPTVPPRWWSEDYSGPERRRPVHNEVKP
ncbi:hypothetical protein BT93_E1578 [Corymbia citriodora subsp. variegata]|nr:hypothetical protein BT93_E1578 [Corymbia citriodora subsp. variegata]